MAKSEQISILVDMEILAEIDADKDRLGRSRNWVINRRLENSRTLPPLYRLNSDGSMEVISDGRETSKKIADVSVGGETTEGVGTPDLSPLGKAQDEDNIQNICLKARSTGFTTVSLPDGVPCGHAGCLSHLSHPCDGCGRIGGMRRTVVVHTGSKALSLDEGWIGSGKNRATYSRIGRNKWSENLMRELADAKSEPGGLKHLSSESLEEITEHAKTDGGAAALLHLAGVELPREILVRWGLAENYKPKLEDTGNGEKIVEGSEGREGKASTEKNRRNSKVVPKDNDGGESAAVGVGKPRVDPEVVASLRDICAGNTPPIGKAFMKDGRTLTPVSGGYVDFGPEPAEVDLCGQKEYNEIDGENYVCGKDKHGPKVRHGDWIKV